MVPYFVADVSVKVKLLEFKSLQVITAAILSENRYMLQVRYEPHCLIRLVILKRPGFQSRKYGMPMQHITLCMRTWREVTDFA